jgi:hypothetical protein
MRAEALNALSGYGLLRLVVVRLVVVVIVGFAFADFLVSSHRRIVASPDPSGPSALA